MAFLEDAARYFEMRPTNGEDRAHWANVYNAKNCRDIADQIARYEKALAEIVSWHADAVDVFPDWKEAADAMASIAAKAMETPNLMPNTLILKGMEDG